MEDGAPAGEQNDPRIGRDPVVFLRARTLGFAAAIEGILADLRTREDLPWSLLNIIGEESPIPDSREADPPVNGSGQAEADVLLSKPANPEQIRIARQLEEHGGVLVQGPPGTGKTHTIGNLIGHLLAQGKSVLVTSHTTKALRMVRHHIVPELRPLCVSVLESDLDSRKQLESAVGSIAERLSRADAGSLETEAKKLEAQRCELVKKLDEIRNQLTEARADEYRDIVIAGKAWAPADAARNRKRMGTAGFPGRSLLLPACRSPPANWPTFTARILPSPATTKMNFRATCRSFTICRALKTSKPPSASAIVWEWRTWTCVPISGNQALHNNHPRSWKLLPPIWRKRLSRFPGRRNGS